MLITLIIKIIIINFLAPPTLERPDREKISVLLGQSSELSCQASGNPLPSITWLKNGQRMDSITNSNIQFTNINHTLFIYNTSKDNAGEYTCVVENTVGKETKNINLDVLGMTT